MKKLMCAFLLTLCCGGPLSTIADNQTPTVSPILPPFSLPFRIELELADFTLPNGVHSGVMGTYKDQWLILAGRTNGLHGFTNTDDNFPPSQQNTTVFVVDPKHKTIASRSLLDPRSGLTQSQVDVLSVTSPQYYQSGNTIYMTGGYGIDTLTGKYTTKDALTAIDVPGLIKWVTQPRSKKTAAKCIKQIFDPIFQVTGGEMTKIGNNPTLLIFGQNFAGAYADSSNGQYTDQVRRFYIINDKNTFYVEKKSSKPLKLDPNYRRRDLNVVPIVRNKGGKLKKGMVALSGVFTPSVGVWTVPVEITADGIPSMASPDLEQTFKQGMNNYVCPTLGLFGKKHNDMYTVLFGGISYGYFQNGSFQTDDEIPFINQITTVRIDRHGNYEQYLMDAEYPVILSTQSNPGNQLLFGAGGQLILLDDLPKYDNGVVQLDKINKPMLVGHIIGGIQSTLPNTNTITDSSASPYIFKVILRPINRTTESSDSSEGS